MAKHTKITKIANLSGLHFYQISDDNEQGYLYMSIDPKEQQLVFYLTTDFSAPVGFIDFKNLGNEKLDFTVLNRRLLWPAVSKAREALQKNEFPNHIDYCA